MVGAAYYTIGLPPPSQSRRTHASLSKIRNNMAKDCLAPVVRQLVLVDIPSIFWWWAPRTDRGRVLEAWWTSNTDGGLAQAFSELATGERDGWRPSLIVSPTIVEGGSRLLISNLDLEGLGGGYELFRDFPGLDLKLCTALRMNAAFPYVTPAVNLPTTPARRVVDAGFLDNYGVDLATEWLERHKEWLLDFVGGVILVETRAYPLEQIYRARELGDKCSGATDPGSGGGPLSDLGAALGVGLQFITTPFDSVMAVNRGTMIDNNNAKVEQLQKWLDKEFKRKTGSETPFFYSVVLQCAEPAPLSWYLTAQDRERIDHAFDTECNQKSFQLLVNLLQGGPRPLARPGRAL
jgi:hypothetical protein